MYRPEGTREFQAQTTAQLRRAGHSTREIGALVHAGELQRIRRGWYMAFGADPDAAEAVYIGGRLTGPSAAVHHRFWTPEDPYLHLLVPRNGSRFRGDIGPTGLRDRNGRPVCLHWDLTPWSMAETDAFAAISDACSTLAETARCRSREFVVAMADSALHGRFVTRSQAAEAIPGILDWCDARSESGTESLVRVRLRSRGVAARPQVQVTDEDRVDLVVGDRLVIECDSAGFHDGYRSERDYDRDLRLIERGFLVVRLKYRHVVYDWDRVEPIILALVREGQHRWSRGARRGRLMAL